MAMLLLKIYYKKYMKYMLSGIPRKSISTYKTTIITTNLILSGGGGVRESLDVLEGEEVLLQCRSHHERYLHWQYTICNIQYVISAYKIFPFEHLHVYKSYQMISLNLSDMNVYIIYSKYLLKTFQIFHKYICQYD